MVGGMVVADGGKSCLIVVDDLGVLDSVAAAGEVTSC
jgi:hypothetical protein